MHRLWNNNEGRGRRKEWSSVLQILLTYAVVHRKRAVIVHLLYIKSDKPVPDLWIHLKKAFLRPAGKPNISLPLLATLKDSPCPKTKRGTSPFVRTSVQLRPRLRSR